MTPKRKRINFIADEYSNVPAIDFVKEVNLSYYKHSADEYDTTHPDVMFDAVKAWKQINRELRIRIPELKEYTVIDIGSGSGFVATRLVEDDLPFKNYIGFEPSDYMRKEAAKKFRDPRVSFETLDISRKDAIFGELESIKGNKIITLNSVLHHIVWWEDFLNIVKNALNQGDTFVLCHEPNKRFWENRLLVSYFDKIIERRRKKKRMIFYLDPMNYSRKVLTVLGLVEYATESRYNIINRELEEAGIIRKTLSPALISAIIDYGVPLCWREIPVNNEYDEGFYSIDYLLENYFKGMEILLYFTYQHLAISLKILSTRWKRKEKRLKEKYPQDGAQFCLVIRKTGKYSV